MLRLLTCAGVCAIFHDPKTPKTAHRINGQTRADKASKSGSWPYDSALADLQPPLSGLVRAVVVIPRC